ncbi:MAG: rod shape-determining protein MreD [Azospirillaceae bacterium]|nr:rod shape-determining protein MreD [Azospirillaceae bacterium]
MIAVLQKLDQFGRNLMPLASTLLLVLLTMVPVVLPGFTAIMPAWGLMAVYYWVVFRPDLLPTSAAFAIGLLQDLLSGTPLGMNALVFVVVHWIVLTQRRFFVSTSFVVLWSGFALVVLIAMSVSWLSYSVLSLTLAPLDAALFQALLSLTVFPVVAVLFIRLHRAFLPA